MPEAGKVVIAGILMVVIATVGITVVDAIDGVNDNSVNQDDAVLLDGTNYVDVNQDGQGSNPTVKDSRGHALAFTGADDSYVELNSDANFYTDDNWTVMQGVWIDPSATTNNMTVLALGDPTDVLLRYSNTSGTANFSAVIMDPGDTYIANVTVSDPTDPHLIYITREDNNVSIYANTTKGESVDTSVSGDINVDLVNDTNLNGRLDETRTFDDVLNDSQRSALVGDSVQPLKNATRTTRIMYDAGSGTAVSVYWSPVSATASNVSYADGFPGHVLDRAGMIADNDYRWKNTGPKIKPSEGGRIDGAPVAFVEYKFIDQLSGFIHGFSSFASIVQATMVVLMTTVLLGAIMKIRAQS